MSHIFDAMQRAEAERSGVEFDAFDVPTELLQIAESSAKLTAAVAEEEPQLPEAQLSESVAMPGEKYSERDFAPVISRPLEQFESLPVMLAPHSRLVSVTEKESLAAEKFRFLAVKLRHMQQQRGLKRLLITSSIPEEGKSMVASNLACTLAGRRQQKTLLLEGDLRCPTLQDRLGMGKVAGLSEYLQGTVDADLPIYRLDALGIWIMAAGSTPQNPLELMQGGRLSTLMARLNDWFDWVVIDSPPILPLADTSVWARLADGILLVARQGTTDKEQLKRGLEAIEPSRLLGAILNSSHKVANYNYYQRYSHEAVAAETKNSKKQG